ncbi:unnamed protein product [Bursaphelenchus okinawaensis]|uniref:glutathione transferase n=1 Tax=Bursaphelenchus okinawaensis TaxID=465554 RepID=A0A811KC63_9BILA|nr:unnamed protein product [Bursaphelenchus okinawaensis]CAG9101438.1 unnamed protein product [Bursaphelenchus okinawaensis]
MPQYELIYFNAAGRAEPIRLCFHYANIPFKDTRVEVNEWAELKHDRKKVPFGLLPVLLVDDKPLCESHAIIRYVAKLTDLDGGSNTDEVAHLDQCYELCRSFHEATRAYFLACRGYGHEDKTKLLDNVFVPNVEKYFGHIRSQLRPSGFFGNTVTYVDFAWFRIIEFYNQHNPEVIQNHPEFLGHGRRIRDIPQLQNYFKNRPETAF